MEQYGIIGKPLGHSFSQQYFTEFFAKTGRDAVYTPFELESIDDFPAVIATHPELVGLNVTLPYKQLVIPYLDALSTGAAAVGAVNVIRVSHPDDDPSRTLLTGHNTDVIGFSRSIAPLLTPAHRHALILGTGGASKAVNSALHELGLDATFVSRTPRDGQFGYGDLTPDVISRYTVIVNATPLGTFPNVESCPPIPYTLLTEAHLCFDLVYNPASTRFLQQAAAQGATVKNGLEMLHIQADEAWKIWTT